MNLRSFWERGGFKVLAVARLSSCSYSMVLYVLNCFVAGIEEIVSSTGELSILLGVPERHVKLAIEELSESNILSITKKHEKTLVIRMLLDPEKWKNLRSTPERNKRMLGDAKNLHSLIPQKEIKRKSKPRKVSLSGEDALVFPKKNETKNYKSNKENLRNKESIDKIISIFSNFQKNEIDIKKEENFAALLLENHSVDQIISLIQFFSKEIPSLSMLAGAWFHYLNKYREEMAEVDDLNAFRKKHEGFDEKIRTLASFELKRIQRERKAITADEELLLHILMRHEQPRKQLYWALKAKDKYPSLIGFLDQAKASVELN
ncbi:hypothetical protein [Fluviispira multicolorata]|uniref:Uncharacterized protein n=1 Tax=Fluviispira multicolorata TaxID=2654512 RepID=A0A833JEF3_9BACT|nr:hypothetical protein [Fluviispira multicolorata]KAB8033184.1 hypothetical protein GCL57_00370 [Fluviispira multicolorata]